jgi:hypothetical protein
VMSIMLIMSCNTEPKKIENTHSLKKDTAVFFPVTNYIKGEINEIIKKGINPIKLLSKGNKVDSVWLKVSEFDTAFHEYIQPMIDSIHLVKFFNESKFADQTLDTYTFTYSPKGNLPDSISLKRWDVYIDRVTNNVKRIYIVKQNQDKELQLTWQSGKWCKTVCIINDTNGKQLIEYEETIKWSFD